MDMRAKFVRRLRTVLAHLGEDVVVGLIASSPFPDITLEEVRG